MSNEASKDLSKQNAKKKKNIYDGQRNFKMLK
jgi:hypothetical protein